MPQSLDVSSVTMVSRDEQLASYRACTTDNEVEALLRVYCHDRRMPVADVIPAIKRARSGRPRHMALRYAQFGPDAEPAVVELSLVSV